MSVEKCVADGTWMMDNGLLGTNSLLLTHWLIPQTGPEIQQRNPWTQTFNMRFIRENQAWNKSDHFPLGP